MIELSGLLIQTRMDIARNIVNKHALSKLAEDEDSDVRCAVAENGNTPAETLSKLAEDEDWQVRRAVAKNEHTPVEILSKLAEDDNYYVRRAVAKNEHTPVETLLKLAEEDIDVKHSAVNTLDELKKE